MYMSQAWLNFGISFFIQLLFFIVSAFYKKRFTRISHIIKWSIPIGLIFGLSFDLIFGKFLGLHSYVLGFGIPFLILNAVLSYGLFTANILLIQPAKTLIFIGWTIIVMAVYEITNIFFHVWTWNFYISTVQLIIVLSVGYLIGAAVIIKMWRVLQKRIFNKLE
jgi:hypothetical protein